MTARFGVINHQIGIQAHADITFAVSQAKDAGRICREQAHQPAQRKMRPIHAVSTHQRQQRLKTR